MPNRLNQAGMKHARSLIRADKVNKTADWSFDAADGNRLLGDPPDWDAYSKWFLGSRPGAEEETKNAWMYPFGKNGKVYRSALIAIRQRAGQQKDTEIFNAAGRLIEEIDAKESAKLVFVAEIGNQTVPESFQIFPFGAVELEGEKSVIVDDEVMDRVVERFETRGLDMVIDYEHQTDTKEPMQAPAAGWIKRLENRGSEGLWAIAEWTERAQEFLLNREYRYFSPVFYVNKRTRRLEELLRVALTNIPRLNWIRPIVAKNDPINPVKKTREEKREMELLKKIAKLFGLPEEGSEEEMLEKIEAKLKADGKDGGSGDGGEDETDRQPIAAKAVLEALDLGEDATESEIVASVHALKQKPAGDAIARLAKLEKESTESRRDDLVSAALRAGKITPAQKDWANEYALRDPKGFELFTAKAPQVMPIDGIEVIGDGNPAGAGLDDVQLSLNRQLGISEETWEKHGPKASE